MENYEKMQILESNLKEVEEKYDAGGAADDEFIE